jgi:hypothetical protein
MEPKAERPTCETCPCFAPHVPKMLGSWVPTTGDCEFYPPGMGLKAHVRDQSECCSAHPEYAAFEATWKAKRAAAVDTPKIAKAKEWLRERFRERRSWWAQDLTFRSIGDRMPSDDMRAALIRLPIARTDSWRQSGTHGEIETLLVWTGTEAP